MHLATQWLVSWLFMAFTYVLAGKLGLMLAIPPGYATAIFPPAGMAVAAILIWGPRILPGILLGSLCLNIWIGSTDGAMHQREYMLALAVAIGASCQAFVAFRLVSNVLPLPLKLTKETAIFKFLILAGPVACVMNASVATLTMFYLGIISSQEIIYNWFTWWVGDSIGVFIVAPLVMTLFAKPYDLWRARRSTLALPLLVALAGVISLFYVTSRLEQQRVETSFQSLASDSEERIRGSIKSYLDSVLFVERFYSSSQTISRAEFNRFVKFTLRDKPGIQGLSWNPVIKAEQRAAYETSIREEGFQNFTILERDAQQLLVPAAARPEYVVVTYIEPWLTNQKAFGFDVASSPERKLSLEAARDRGHLVATARLNLVQGDKTSAGFLVFQPVYDGIPFSLEQRRKTLVGYAVGVFRVQDIIEKALNASHRNQVVIYVEDVTESTPVALYGSQGNHPMFMQSGDISIGDRRWQITFMPSPVYLQQNRSFQAWSMLLLGMLFISLLGAFLLAMSGRSYYIASEVERKTAELQGILSTADEAILTLNAQGLIESLNPAGESLFGYPIESVLGKPISLLLPDFYQITGVHTQGEELFISPRQRTQTSAMTQEGRQVPVELAISSLLLTNKLLYTVIAHDLTQQQKINRMKDEFVSMVSHELRTPLTSIIGSLGLLRGGACSLDSPQGKNMIDIAYDNGERLVNLVNDLLSFNKAALTDTPLNKQCCMLNQLLEQAIEANQGYVSRYGVRFAWQPAEDAMVEVDTDKMLQVLANLISNAAKYSSTGGVITIQSELVGALVRVSVKDEGSGIPTEFQSKVFEKFAQADSSDTRRVGGTGLGMAISKSIIEQHGGKIYFVSEPNKGTTFYFELMVKAAG